MITCDYCHERIVYREGVCPLCVAYNEINALRCRLEEYEHDMRDRDGSVPHG